MKTPSFDRPLLRRGVILIGLATAPWNVDCAAQSQPALGADATTGIVGKQLPSLPPNARRTAVPAPIEKNLAVLKKIRSSNAQKASPANPSSAPHQAQIIAYAKARIMSNDLAGAEEAIAATSPFEPNTSAWYMDAGYRLRAISEDIARDGKQVSAVAAVSLRHFEDAFSRAQQDGDRRGQAAAKLSAAFLHERYLGDPISAITAYKAALQAYPEDTAAQEGLTRLEQSLAILDERVRGRGK